MPTDPEPSPRLTTSESRAQAPMPVPVYALPRSIKQPQSTFLDVIQSRRSLLGKELSTDDLSALLWHATSLRERRLDGRFNVPWESRPAPSAAGLHPICTLVLPLSGQAEAGLYVPDAHAIAPIDSAALALNHSSVVELLGQAAGTTLQFAYDLPLLESCYDNARSLMWRDAGGFAATVCLVATSLGLTSVVLGRTGDAIVRAGGLASEFVGVGAVHLGGPRRDVV